MSESFNLDWSEIVFSNKKKINELNATFIAAPRDISQLRFKQLIKSYLPYGNMIIGVAKEKYIDGFIDQPQFKTLEYNSIKSTIDQVNKKDFKYKIFVLSYFQRDINFILEKLKLKKVIFINGSWKYSFHLLPIYYTLASKRINYELVTPFSTLNEAKSYESRVMPRIQMPKKLLNDAEMIKQAENISRWSFDYIYQTGAVLGKKLNNKYKVIAQGFNKVVPYQTYAMYNGSIRESNFSPINDLNFYDTIHAEAEIIIIGQKNKIDFKKTTLFMNLLPCPNCARMICETDIDELIYKVDHSDGYAIRILEDAGKKVRRAV